MNIYNFEAALGYRALMYFLSHHTAIKNRLRIKDNLLRHIPSCAGEFGIGTQSAGVRVDGGPLSPTDPPTKDG